MPRSQRTRKNQEKREWGKNNPQTKAKNRKTLMIIGVIAIAVVAVSVFVVLEQNTLFATSVHTTSGTSTPAPTLVVMPESEATPLTSPANEYSPSSTRVQLTVQGTDGQGSFIGNITLQMRNDKPTTTTNFVNLVNQGFYDNTYFHRIVANFMIQAGKNSTKTVSAINDEIGSDNHNTVGTIAMAKTSDPNSATSEFFINVVDNSQITYSDGTKFDDTYTVFGQVIGGMDIVMRLSQVPCTTNPYNGEQSVPINDVTLIKAVVLP
jgi:cyclophilin family peptidyl-prolyl cis-trans isomerase